MVNNLDIRRFDPFFVGVDRMWRHLDDLHKMADAHQGAKYPPYNIVKTDDENYAIDMAVAGFSENDIDLTLEDGKLTITGKVEKEDAEGILYKGIANRSFVRQFTLADTIEIEGAELANGMLRVSLKNIIPDHKKPKKIEIKTGDKLSAKKELLIEG